MMLDWYAVQSWEGEPVVVAHQLGGNQAGGGAKGKRSYSRLSVWTETAMRWEASCRARHRANLPVNVPFRERSFLSLRSSSRIALFDSLLFLLRFLFFKGLIPSCRWPERSYSGVSRRLSRVR